MKTANEIAREGAVELGMKLAAKYKDHPGWYVELLHECPSQLVVWSFIHDETTRMEPNLPRLDKLAETEQAEWYNKARSACKLKHTRMNIILFARFFYILDKLI